MSTNNGFTVNGRHYPSPQMPVVVICIDGCEPAYLDHAIDAGLMPTMARMRQSGFSSMADSAIPSFTNPNNLSIATGTPPAVHGICGNYFLDPESGQEVMMNDVRFLRTGTIFAAAQAAGFRVAVVTAKDKLRSLLGAGLDCSAGEAWCFSAERAEDSTREENGIANAAGWVGRAQPDVYSAELSEFVFAAGVRLLHRHAPEFMYLTTTDFVQHKFAPDHPTAMEFNSMIDRYLAELDDAGAVIVVTADHGMKAKHDQGGQPVVVYVQDLLDEMLGNGLSRVILPITDPYVVHHGSLGSFATAYLPDGTDPGPVLDGCRQAGGVELVLTGDEAASRFELPRDRIGDIVLLSASGTVLGKSRRSHDLASLDAPLRSHGGLSEQVVPFVANRRVELDSGHRLRNFDAFHVAARAASLEN